MVSVQLSSVKKIKRFRREQKKLSPGNQDGRAKLEAEIRRIYVIEGILPAPMSANARADNKMLNSIAINQ